MHTRLLLALAISLPLAGCVANMSELKHNLGVEEHVEAPMAPSAKATASAAVARVLEPVRFSAVGSSDPQASPLEFAWTFGDGAGASGEQVVHSFAAAGSYSVTLVARNELGVADVDLVRVEVLADNPRPVARGSVLPARGWVGQTLAFSAGGSHDPAGESIRWLWNFGDGTTAAIAEPAHAFSAPGRHQVELTVLDEIGQATQAVVVVPVSHAENRTGVLDATAGRIDLPLAVPGRAASLHLSLAFEASPANDLGLEVRDAAGRLIDATPPRASTLGGEGRLVLDLVEPEGAWGTWTVSVLRHSGVRVAWTLSSVLAY